MRALIQRVKQASVTVEGEKISEIGLGLLTLLGVQKGDDEERLRKLVQKIVELRIFEDEAGKMNRSLVDIHGGHLIVSQFTLAADTRSGRRPSFTTAETPATAKILYEKAIELSRSFGLDTKGGSFGANMQVALINDGPATFLLDS